MTKLRPAEQSEEAVDKSTETVLNVLADDDESPEEEMFPEIKYSPTGKPIPDGYHWDGTRRVKTYKGVKAPRLYSIRFVENAQSKGQRKAHR